MQKVCQNSKKTQVVVLFVIFSHSYSTMNKDISVKFFITFSDGLESAGCCINCCSGGSFVQWIFT